MNCLEFRRLVGAEPSSMAPTVLAHRDECAACARYQGEMRAMDRLLGQAMRIDVVPASAREGSDPAAGSDPSSAKLYRAVPAAGVVPGSRREEVSGTRSTVAAGGNVVSRVPDAPASRVPGTSRADRGTTPPRRWLAMAASLVGGVLVAATLWLSYPGPTLAAEVIGHVVSESDALQSSRPLAAQAIAEVLDPSGVRLRPGVGTVTFAMRCVFEGRVVPHLVVQTAEGPVTVLLLAHRQVEAATRIEADGYSALVLPAPRGSIAIVGRDESRIDSIARQIFDGVDWET